MTERGEATRRPPRAPMARRTRKRWAVAAALAACWALLLKMTGSVVAGTVLLLFLLALGTGCVMALRVMGVSAAHPWVQRLRSRPWRDGQEVLQLSLRHLPEVFVMTPGGSLLAPNSIELWLSPRDFGSLCELIDLSLVNASVAEVYAEQVAAYGARFARPGAAQVRVVGDPCVPAGRYRLRQARPIDSGPACQPDPYARLAPAGPPPLRAGAQPAGPVPRPDAPAQEPRPVPHVRAGDWPYAHDGHTRAEAAPGGTVITGLPTVTERDRHPVPVLRLVTGDSVTETRVPGARAGRGDVELVLPEVLTVSREHARFTYAGGRWWITNLGRNGLTLNGVPLTGQHAVHDGDSIRWGSKADALVSRVEIG